MTIVNLEHLVEVLAQVRGVNPDSVSATADLADQGVDSLTGLRFARKIEDLTGSEVKLEWLFDNPNLEQLAAFLESQAVREKARPQ